MILSQKEEIVSLVRDRWQRGVRPDGTIIGVYRSIEYQQYKAAKNPEAGGNVDLILTGDLSFGLTLNKVMNVGYTIFSTDEKANMIADKYGLDVFGLTDEEMDLLNEEITKRIIESIIKKINGLF